MRRHVLSIIFCMFLVCSALGTALAADQICSAPDYQGGTSNHCDEGFFDFVGQQQYRWWSNGPLLPKWSGLQVFKEAQGSVAQEILGTDLGYPITIGGIDYYFFGDSQRSIISPTYEPNGYLPFAMANNRYHASPYEVINVFGGNNHISMTDYGRTVGELLNQNEAAYVEQFFWVPTGVVADGSTIFYFYGKYIFCSHCDSSNLILFEKGQWEFVGTFADRKFIQISPVIVSAADNIVANEKGVFLYGTGRDVPNNPDPNTPGPWWDETSSDLCGRWTCPTPNFSYHESDLYLAYISFADLSAGLFENTLYWDGTDFTGEFLDDAEPLMLNGPENAHGIGEFSIVKIPGEDCHDNYFLCYVGATESDGFLPYYVRPLDITEPYDVPLERFITSSHGGANTPYDSSYGYGQYAIPSSVQVLSMDPDYVEIGYDRVVSNSPPHYGTTIVRSRVRVRQEMMPGFCGMDD